MGRIDAFPFESRACIASISPQLDFAFSVLANKSGLQPNVTSVQSNKPPGTTSMVASIPRQLRSRPHLSCSSVASVFTNFASLQSNVTTVLPNESCLQPHFPPGTFLRHCVPVSPAKGGAHLDSHYSQYSPTSPAYSPTSPAYSPTSPQVSFSSFLCVFVYVLAMKGAQNRFASHPPQYSPTSKDED